jgi:hypothetical protein
LGLSRWKRGKLLDDVAHPLDIELSEPILGHMRLAFLALEPSKTAVDINKADKFEPVKNRLVILALENSLVDQVFYLQRLEQVHVLVPSLCKAAGPGVLAGCCVLPSSPTDAKEIPSMIIIGSERSSEIVMDDFHVL